jgi:hypothetical protein
LRSYVVFQENSAVAEVNINNGVIDKISPLPKKSWDSSGIDVSDRDGGNGTSGTYSSFLLMKAPAMWFVA